MAAEIDPVIFEFHARQSKFLADIRATTRTVDNELGLQEKRVKRLEREFRSSSSSIAGSLKGLAGTLAAAFTGRELVGLIDQFTRFENSLKVAGLEGERLAQVQDRLFATGARYGVSVNALADLYGKAEQAGRELGASQQELLALTDATAQALLVSGVSTAQASGAILGLTQALSSGTVRAEEFNQINEGGLRVLLEAAAASDRFGGSIAKLRSEVVAGTVSSQELYRAILQNADLIEDKASTATLTLAGAFQSLQDQLARYVGEAAKANGVTSALAAGIQGLADNLDTIIPLIAIVAAGLGVGYVTNVVRATVATATLGATAAATGRTLLAAFGGPVGLAITAVGLALAFVVTQSETTAQSIDRLAASTDATEREVEAMEGRLRAAGVAMDTVKLASDDASDGIDGVSRSAVTAKQRLYELEQQSIRTAVRLVDLQLQENSRRRVAVAQAARNPEINQTASGLALRENGNPRQRAADAQSAELDREFRILTRKRNAIIAGVRNGVDVNGDAIPQSAPVPTTGTATKATGPSAGDIASRQASEINRLQQEELRARIQLATDVDQRAELERDLLQLEYEQRKAEIAGDTDLSAQQKAAQLAIVEKLYGIDGALNEQGEIVATGNKSLYALQIEREAALQRERDAQETLDAKFRAEIESLRLQQDLADTEKDRRDIAFRILDAEDAYLRERLQSVIAAHTINGQLDQQGQIAQLQLDALNADAANRAANLTKQTQGALARYARSTKDVDARIEEITARRIQEINDTIADTLADKLGVRDPFLKQLLSIFLEKNIFGPLAEALASQGGGGGGILGGIISGIGSLFGRASGGPVSAGRIYRINEGASPGRVEAFRPDASGEIIPLGRMDAIRSGGGGASAPGVAVVRLQLTSDLDARIVSQSTGVAVEVVKNAAPQIVDAAANETFRRGARPSI